jgi:predicted nucleic acid-binding protein
MILIDTSVWIDFLRQRNETLNAKLYGQLEIGNVAAFSPVFGELLQGVRNDREENLVLDLWNDLPQVEDAFILLEAGRLSHQNKLFNKGIGLIDCTILAACKKNNLELWTSDQLLLQAANSLKIRRFG